MGISPATSAFFPSLTKRAVARAEGVSDAEFFEALNVALIVGGSVTIPHLRRAVETLDWCREKKRKGERIEF
jgi:hypothetical protein